MIQLAMSRERRRYALFNNYLLRPVQNIFECPKTPYMNMPYIFSAPYIMSFYVQQNLGFRKKNMTTHNLDPHTGSTVLLNRVVVLSSGYQKLHAKGITKTFSKY